MWTNLLVEFVPLHVVAYEPTCYHSPKFSYELHIWTASLSRFSELDHALFAYISCHITHIHRVNWKTMNVYYTTTIKGAPEQRNETPLRETCAVIYQLYLFCLNGSNARMFNAGLCNLWRATWNKTSAGVHQRHSFCGKSNEFTPINSWS